jgi:hypothetical protein
MWINPQGPDLSAFSRSSPVLLGVFVCFLIKSLNALYSVACSHGRTDYPQKRQQGLWAICVRTVLHSQEERLEKPQVQLVKI